MSAYYNEINAFAAQWLRNLIEEDLIAPGVVDERSIEDVSPDDLREFTQCHYFAGIGIWSWALRRAGWEDTRPAWSGSCPCQPFSQAGKGAGFADERHLWPHFFYLIQKRRPPAIYGEQVASPDGLAWLDTVQTDLESQGYAFAAFDLCGAGFGSPDIRQRLFWVAYSDHARLEGRAVSGECAAECAIGAGSVVSGMEQPHGQRWERGQIPTPGGIDYGAHARWAEGKHGFIRPDENSIAGTTRPGPVNGFWRAADWLGCTDNKLRPVEPGTFPLVDGYSNRMELLRAYGNAIKAPVAIEFIQAAMECMP